MPGALPAPVTASIFNLLVPSTGLVPATYSCRLLKPSPSGSALGVARGSLIDGKYCSSQASGKPSASVSPGVLTALFAPAVGDAASQLGGSSPKFEPTLRCSELPVAAALVAHGGRAEELICFTRT